MYHFQLLRARFFIFSKKWPPILYNGFVFGSYGQEKWFLVQLSTRQQCRSLSCIPAVQERESLKNHCMCKVFRKALGSNLVPWEAQNTLCSWLTGMLCCTNENRLSNCEITVHRTSDIFLFHIYYYIYYIVISCHCLLVRSLSCL